MSVSPQASPEAVNTSGNDDTEGQPHRKKGQSVVVRNALLVTGAVALLGTVSYAIYYFLFAPKRPLPGSSRTSTSSSTTNSSTGTEADGNDGANAIAAPGSLSIGSLTYQTVTLDWDVVDNASSYNICYTAGSSFSASAPPTLLFGVASPPYTISGLFQHTGYCVGVESVHASGVTSELVAVTGSTAAQVLPAPSSVELSTSTFITNTSIPIQWSSVLGATSYTIWYQPGASVSAASPAIAITGLTSSPYTVRSLSPDTTYTFGVVAVGVGNNGAAIYSPITPSTTFYTTTDSQSQTVSIATSNTLVINEASVTYHYLYSSQSNTMTTVPDNQFSTSQATRTSLTLPSSLNTPLTLTVTVAGTSSLQVQTQSSGFSPVNDVVIAAIQTNTSTYLIPFSTPTIVFGASNYNTGVVPFTATFSFASNLLTNFAANAPVDLFVRYYSDSTHSGSVTNTSVTWLLTYE
jgi:hypothetical protein